jgi:hypothetical protein
MGDPHRQMGKERERREKRIPRFAPFVPQGKRNDNSLGGGGRLSMQIPE